jgi:undecaprenyl-diphosphatase
LEISWWQAVVLGLTQGLTEFIPVSSSAHLNIVHAIFGQDRKLAFDVVLSVGTTAALAWYFRHDWKALLTKPEMARLRNLVFIGCVPAVIFGVLIRKAQDNPPISAVWFNATMLIVGGLILLWADFAGRKVREVETVTLKDALLVGIAQALALFPGVSRSGATISAGLFLGMTREAAARFSFLLSLPISLGAVLYEFKKDVVDVGGFSHLGASPVSLLLGVVVSGASGLWAIGFLLNYLKNRNVIPFVAWRVVVGIGVLLLMSGKAPDPGAAKSRAGASKPALASTRAPK